MKYGRFINERTIKTGPIKRTIQDPDEFMEYRNSSSQMFADVDLINFAKDITEGVIWYQGSKAIYKVSSKMVTQSPFEHVGGTLHPKDKETLDKIWAGNLRYYIPDVYFYLNFGFKYRGFDGLQLIFEKNIFMPILNLFRPNELNYMYNHDVLYVLSRLFVDGIWNYISSTICYGRSLSKIDTSVPTDILANIGHICNTILSAPSNSDLLPVSDKSSVWILGTARCYGLSMDFILRALSNISQKISQEEYLELLRKSHKDPRHIFNKLLEVNEYSEEETEEYTDLFLRTQFDYTYIENNRDRLIKELRELEG